MRLPSFKIAAITCTLAFVCAAPSNADTGTFQFTVQTLENAINGLSTFDGGACDKNLDNCGIYKIAVISFSGAPATSSVSGGIVPSGTSSNWLFSSSPTPNALTDDNALNTGITFISTNPDITSSHSYTGPGTNAQTGNGFYNASTNLGFILTDTNGAAFTSAVTFTFKIFMADFVSATDATQASLKTSADFVTLSVNPTPEPSSILLFVGAIPVFALVRRRMRRRG
jgi:hypothetical protein